MKPEEIGIGQELKIDSKLLDSWQQKLLVEESKQDIIVIFQMWVIKPKECVVIVPSRYLAAVETTPMATKWVLPFSPKLFSPLYYRESIYFDKGTADRLVIQHSLEERLAIVEAQLDSALNKLDKLDKLDDKLDSLISHLVPQNKGCYREY